MRGTHADPKLRKNLLSRSHFWAGLLVLACSGRIGSLPGSEPGSSPGATGGPGVTGTGSTPGQPPVLPPARDPMMAGYTPGEQGVTDRPAPTTRFARLTHTQWANTVHDLFDLSGTDAIAKDFRSDPTQQGFLFDNAGGSLSVDDALWSSYQRAAADIASQVTSNASTFSSILPTDTGDANARAKQFITDFGLKVFRRPLTDAEISDYVTIYGAGATAYTGMSAFDGGIRLVLEAFLQSPYFLYRVESSATKSGDVVPLSPYEIASRLSYMLWNTMPDADLFTAAANGQLALADQVATQANRMLDDPRSEDVIAHFHAQLMNVDHYETIAPLQATFPNAPQNLGTLATTETDRFVRSIAASGGGFKELMTSTKTFANSGLASIYDVSDPGSTFAEVSLDATQRKGILTQVGFLASNATTTTPDPIHRGVFVARRLLCAHISAPPGNVPPLPPAGNRTNRETVEAHTQQPGSVCITCHGATINPLGFPFESFDAIGAWRTEDAGKPVNTATDPTIDGQTVHVADALGLVDAIAASQEGHACYARHWLEFGYGRPSVDIDDALVTRLGADSAKGTLSIKNLIVGLVKTESFLTRSAEELP